MVDVLQQSFARSLIGYVSADNLPKTTPAYATLPREVGVHPMTIVFRPEDVAHNTDIVAIVVNTLIHASNLLGGISARLSVTEVDGYSGQLSDGFATLAGFASPDIPEDIQNTADVIRSAMSIAQSPICAGVFVFAGHSLDPSGGLLIALPIIVPYQS